MNFKCLPKNHSFSVEKPKEVEGLWHWKGALHCPYCRTAELQEELMVSLPKDDLVKARRENREATMAAQQMAGKARQEQNERDPEVTLAPIQGAGAFAKAGPMKVRKSIMDGIAAKTPDNAFQIGA